MTPRLTPAGDIQTAYVTWRAHARAVWDAYERWSAAASGDAFLAYATYAAALDRERRAAARYAEAARLEPGSFYRPLTS